MNHRSPITATSETGFRHWLRLLMDVRGHQPYWPVVLGATWDAEFQRQIQIDSCYSSAVFIDRDNHQLKDGNREERQVANLYRSALSSDGCVTLGNERIWLLGFQWPTQGGDPEKKRSADLVGITTTGALVVFEAKVAIGSAPLIAIMEGLDYLACLLRSRNFTKILSGFEAWKAKSGKSIPQGFEETLPDRTQRPTLVILAPEAYFTGRYTRSIRGKDWPFLATIGDTMMKSVRQVFASTDFKSTTLHKMTKSKK